MSAKDLPQTNEKIYDCIYNAVLYFNNKLRLNVGCVDGEERLSEELSNDHLLILAHIIKLNILENELIHFSTLFQPFQKDIGIKNFNAQLNVLERRVENQKEFIGRLIVNTEEDYL